MSRSSNCRSGCEQTAFETKTEKRTQLQNRNVLPFTSDHQSPLTFQRRGRIHIRSNISIKHPEATQQHIPCIARNTITVSPCSLLAVVATTGERSKAHRELAPYWWLAFLFRRRSTEKCSAFRNGSFNSLHLVRTKTKVQEPNTSQTCVLTGDFKRTRSSVLVPAPCLDVL